MLIDVDDIRKVRQIAKNIDSERVQIYIKEAEILDVLPRIGAEFYQKLSNIGALVLTDEDKLVLSNNDSNIVIESEYDLPINEWKFLNGGYYLDSCGEKKRFEGVRSALCYFAYARFVRNHASQVTPFGVVNKMGDDSSMVSEKTIAAMAQEAQKIGDEYLDQALDFWKEVRTVNDIPAGTAKKRRRFIPIGD